MITVPYKLEDSLDSPKLESKIEDGEQDNLKIDSDGSSQLENATEPSNLDQARENALLRKIDWHVVPWLSLLYLLSFLDRANIGNARVRPLLSSYCLYLY